VKNIGTNFPVSALAFDATNVENAYWKWSPVGYGSGNVLVEVRWYADTGSSGNVFFGASLAAITPDTDTQDVETKSFANINTATDAHLGTTNQRLHTMPLTISNLDSLAAGDMAVLRLFKQSAAASNMTGDCLVVEVILSYSDT
jgi:hypothetical protein